MGTRRIDIGCTFVQWSQRPVHAVFQVEPVLGGIATISDEEWWSDPAIQTRSYRDSYGNRCRRLMLPAGRSEITFRAKAEVPDATEEIDLDAPEIAPADLPDDVMIYTLPSRFCLPDVLANEAWSRFGGVKPGYGRVQAICDYVHGHLTFQYGSTTALSSAVDVNRSGRGVCLLGPVGYHSDGLVPENRPARGQHRPQAGVAVQVGVAASGGRWLGVPPRALDGYER